MMTRYQSSNVRRPPSVNLYPAYNKVIFRTNAQPASSKEGGDNHGSNRECLMNRLISQEEEIKQLKSEMQKLQKFVLGVNVLGRPLAETKKENRRLLSEVSVSSVEDECNIDISNYKKPPYIESDSKQSISDHGDCENNGIQKFLLDQADETMPTRKKTAKENGTFQTKKCEEQELCKENEGKHHIAGNLKDGSNGVGKLQERYERERKEDHKKGMRPSRSDKQTRKSNKDVDISTSPDSPSDVDINTYDCVTTADKEAMQGSSNCILMDTDYEQLCVSIGVDTKELDWEKNNELIRKENNALKRQLDEIAIVNIAWDQFWTRKEISFEAILAEKEKIIANLQQSEAANKIKLETAIADKEQTLKEQDEMLLLTKARINKLESIIDQLRRDLAQYHEKNERAQKLARTLLKHKGDLELEIKRLNEILEVKIDLPTRNVCALSQQPEINCETPTCTEDDKSDNETNSKPTMPMDDMKTHCTKKQDELQLVHRESVSKVQQQNEIPSQLPLLGREGNVHASLTKDELKERIMLLEEHKDAYESDFKKERRDREKAVGKLNDMKEKLGETKQKLKQRKQCVHPQTPFQRSAKRANDAGQYVYIPVKCCYSGQKKKTNVHQEVPANTTHDKHHRYIPQRHHPRDKDAACICPW